MPFAPAAEPRVRSVVAAEVVTPSCSGGDWSWMSASVIVAMTVPIPTVLPASQASSPIALRDALETSASGNLFARTAALPMLRPAPFLD